MNSNIHRALALCSAMAAHSGSYGVELEIPNCRMVDRFANVVTQTARQVHRVFVEEQWQLPFSRVVVNPTGRLSDDALTVYVVEGASPLDVDESGCAHGNTEAMPTSERDRLSVHGGCLVPISSVPQIRCDAHAVALFLGSNDIAQPHPAFLYVIAHEFAHLHQGRRGEFSGRFHRIDGQISAGAKLRYLRSSCDPRFIEREKEADKIAVDVLTQLLPTPEYRNPILSSRGSMMWQIDEIRLVADAWAQLQGDELSEVSTHDAFRLTEFPATAGYSESQAKSFVCDVLTQTTGQIAYPYRESTHPAPEQRLREIAESVSLIATKLPSSDGHTDFKPIQKLQEDLSEIFAFMTRGNAEYLESLHAHICSIVNRMETEQICR